MKRDPRHLQGIPLPRTIATDRIFLRPAAQFFEISTFSRVGDYISVTTFADMGPQYGFAVLVQVLRSPYAPSTCLRPSARSNDGCIFKSRDSLMAISRCL